MEITSKEFLQIVSFQNEKAKDQLASKYIKEISYKLFSFPYNYEKDVCEKVGRGIIFCGEEIHSNAMIEYSEDEEDEYGEGEEEDESLVQMNELGKHFNTLLSICILEISYLDLDKEISTKLENMNSLYLFSENVNRMVKKYSVTSFSEYISILKDFIYENASLALTFCLQSLIPIRNEEIIFEEDFVVPKTKIIEYIKNTFKELTEKTPINIHICFPSDKNLEVITFNSKTLSEEEVFLISI